MASRQRTGGVTDLRPRQTNRPVYEDFNPKIDTIEGEEARVVVMHLPGFIKEQIRITAEQDNNIRVQGQRPLLNNTWSRIVQLIPIPRTCEVDKIHAKFHNGILTITLPKETTNRDNVIDTPPKVVPPTVSEPNQRAAAAAELRAQKGHEKTHQQPPTSAEKMPQRAGPEEQMAKRVDPAAERDVTKMGGEKTHQTQTGAEKITQRAGPEEQMVKSVDLAAERDVKKMGGSPIPRKEVTEPKGQKGHEKADQTQTGAEKMVKKVDPAAERDVKKVGPAEASTELDAGKVREAVSPTPSRSERHKNVSSEAFKGPEPEKKTVEKSSEATKEITAKGKEQERAAPPAEVAAVSKVLEDGKRALEKLVSGDANEKKPKKEDGEGSNVNKLGIKNIAETAKQTVSNAIKSLNEDDRQMLINIGAAVMVLVALGAYISYGQFGSSTEGEN